MYVEAATPSPWRKLSVTRTGVSSPLDCSFWRRKGGESYVAFWNCTVTCGCIFTNLNFCLFLVLTVK